MPAEFLCNLPKNLTTHLTHKLYSVFPKEKSKKSTQFLTEIACFLIFRCCWENGNPFR